MKIISILLIPITLIYGLIIILRNYLYEKQILKSIKFTFPVICIGNLSAGGTGKTPHTDYLINLIKNDYKIGVLSRGYNRKSSGFIELQTNSNAVEVGDEPLFYKWKHPNIKVAVCEDRVSGISQMAMGENNDLVYLLDDAFQHRAIKAGLYILLTDYNNLYVDDYLLPSGRLREPKKGANRADIIIVSKCPYSITEAEKFKISKKIKAKKYQFLVFSSMKYKSIYSLLNNNVVENEKNTEIVLVTGISKPKPLIDELETRFKNVFTRKFSDHYNYKLEDIESIIRTYNNLDTKNKILLTTEKDATRLFAFKNEFLKANIDIYCIPIEVFFDKKEKHIFDKAIKHYLNITLPKIEEENYENIEI